MSTQILPKSRVALPTDGGWETLLDFFAARFERIDLETWRSRFERGLILDTQGQSRAGNEPYLNFAGSALFYRREVEHETPIPFSAEEIFEDEHILVVDKPHFLPVLPAGAYVVETLLTRLQQKHQIPELTPAHRIDQGTAGLVLFCKTKTARNAYHALFREHRILKTYQAVAGFRADLVFPMRYCSRLETGEHFMQMREVAGPANCETDIELLRVIDESSALYALRPKTGKKHQLRAQLSALGIAIKNDPIYPSMLSKPVSLDFSKPLQLLAQGLQFTDPLCGIEREFRSTRQLLAATSAT